MNRSKLWFMPGFVAMEKNTKNKLLIITPQELAELGILDSLSNIKLNKTDGISTPTTKANKLDPVQALRSAIKKKMTLNDKLVFKKPVEPGTSKVKKVQAEKLTEKLEVLNVIKKPAKTYQRNNNASNKKVSTIKCTIKSKTDKNESKVDSKMEKTKGVSIISNTNVHLSKEDLDKIVGNISNPIIKNSLSNIIQKQTVESKHDPQDTIINDVSKKSSRKNKHTPNIVSQKSKQSIKKPVAKATLQTGVSEMRKDDTEFNFAKPTKSVPKSSLSSFNNDKLEIKSKDDPISQTGNSDVNITSTSENTGQCKNEQTISNKTIEYNNSSNESNSAIENISTETNLNIIENASPAVSCQKVTRSDKNEEKILNVSKTSTTHESSSDSKEESPENIDDLVQRTSEPIIKKKVGRPKMQSINVSTEDVPKSTPVQNLLKTIQNEEKSIKTSRERNQTVNSKVTVDKTMEVALPEDIKTGGKQEQVLIDDSPIECIQTRTSKQTVDELIEEKLTENINLIESTSPDVSIEKSNQKDTKNKKDIQRTDKNEENSLDVNKKATTHESSSDSKEESPENIDDLVQRTSEPIIKKKVGRPKMQSINVSTEDVPKSTPVQNLLKTIQNEEKSIKTSRERNQTVNSKVTVDKTMEVALPEDIKTGGKQEQVLIDDSPIECIQTRTSKQTVDELIEEKLTENINLIESTSPDVSIEKSNQKDTKNKKDIQRTDKNEENSLDVNKKATTHESSSDSKEESPENIDDLVQRTSEPIIKKKVGRPKMQSINVSTEDVPKSTPVQNLLKTIQNEEKSIKTSRERNQTVNSKVTVDKTMEVALPEDIKTGGKQEQVLIDDSPIECIQTRTSKQTVDELIEEKLTENINLIESTSPDVSIEKSNQKDTKNKKDIQRTDKNEENSLDVNKKATTYESASDKNKEENNHLAQITNDPVTKKKVGRPKRQSIHVSVCENSPKQENILSDSISSESIKKRKRSNSHSISQINNSHDYSTKKLEKDGDRLINVISQTEHCTTTPTTSICQTEEVTESIVNKNGTKRRKSLHVDNVGTLCENNNEQIQSNNEISLLEENTRNNNNIDGKYSDADKTSVEPKTDIEIDGEDNSNDKHESREINSSVIKKKKTRIHSQDSETEKSVALQLDDNSDNVGSENIVNLEDPVTTVPKKKRGRKPKSECASSPAQEKIELPIETSRSGRKRVKLNYFELDRNLVEIQDEPNNARFSLTSKSIEDQPNNLSTSNDNDQSLESTAPKKKRGRKPKIKSVTPVQEYIDGKLDKLDDSEFKKTFISKPEDGTSTEPDNVASNLVNTDIHKDLSTSSYNGSENTAPKKKKGRIPKSECAPSPAQEIELPTSRSGRKRVKINYFEVDGKLTEEIQINKRRKLEYTEIQDEPDNATLISSDIDQLLDTTAPQKKQDRKPKIKCVTPVEAEDGASTESYDVASKKTNLIGKTTGIRGRRKKVPDYPQYAHRDDQNNVTCGICNIKVDFDEWMNHNETVHNNLGWRLGEFEIRLDDTVLLKNILTPLLSENKKLVCFKCKAIHTKIHEFISHKEECDGISCNGEVKCAICSELMVAQAWSKHKLKHHNLAWRIGDPPLDINNESLVIQILKKAKKPFQCEKCKEVKKSVMGFLSHRGQCGLSEDEAKISCEVCGRRCLPSSMPTHMKQQHSGNKEVVDTKTENDYFHVDLNISLRKRKAATKALSMLDQFSKGDKLEHFKFYVKQLNFDENKELITFLDRELEENKILVCKITGCEFVTETSELLLEHMNECALKPAEYYACNKCYSICLTEDEIIEHLQQVHDHKINLDDDYEEQNKSSTDEEDVEEEVDEENDLNNRKPARVSRNAKKIIETKKGENGSSNLTPNFVIETSRKNFNKITLYSHAFQFSFEFCQTHFTATNLFENFYSKSMDLVEENVQQYLPPSDVSCDVSEKIVDRIENIYSAEYSFKKFELFEVEKGDAHLTIFCGGPIRSLAWLPTPYTSLNEVQILAVAIGQDFNGIYRVDGNYTERTSIQFWNFGILKNRQNLQTPTLEFGLIFDYGPIWHMEWCPTGCFNPENNDKGSRMGLLAVAGSVMTVNVYSMPFIKEEETGLFYKLKPVLRLQLVSKESDLKRTIFATKISWSKVSGCNSIAVGYSDGNVAIYNLKFSSNLLKFKDENSIDVLLPHQIIKAHTHFISILSWVPIEGDRLLLTSSYDKNAFVWDLFTEDKFTTKRKKILTDGTWLTNWLSFITANDETTLSNGYVTLTQYSHRDYLNENCNLSYSNGTILTLSANDWLNGFIQANTVGEIVASFPHQMLVCQDRLKKGFAYRCLLGYTKLIDKTKSPEERAIIEKRKQDFLKLIPRTRTCSTVKDMMGDKDHYDTYEPLDYQESIDQYGVLFCDIEPGNTHTLRGQSAHPDCSKPNLYPLQEINKISFNPNRQASLYYAAGYQIGFIRLNYIKSLENDAQINKSEIS